MNKLKLCPFCGSEADYYVGYIQCVHCLANIPYRYGLSYADGKAEAIEAWNRRAAPENKPLTLEELRKMDGEPAYVQEGDGTEGWAVVCWDSPETLFLYGPEFDPVFEPDLDFINMEYNDPDGHFGLHILGWRALRRKPEVSE